MAERDLEQAFYVTNQANSAFYPSITLSGSAGWTNSVGGPITNPGKFVTSALASLAQPLFNRGTLIARRRIAKAQQEEALLAFEQKLLDAGTEVNEALVSYQISKRKKVLRKSGGCPGKGLHQYVTADAAWQYYLSGSADCPADVVKCPALSNR